MHNTDRRTTLSLPQHTPNQHGLPTPSHTPAMPATASPRKPGMIAKGHDAILKGLQDRTAQISIFAISGELYEGAVVARDRWTITIRDKNNTNVTIYKHAIESFGNVVPA